MHTLPLIESEFTRLPARFYQRVAPTPLSEPYWVAQNQVLATELNVPPAVFEQPETLWYLSGSARQYQPAPLASVYSGHQFGQYVSQLGDGRALLLGDSLDAAGQRWEWQLKGAGKTPFSRFADGRAVLRSSIREYLCSEAMHGLGIPTTRALALTGSNDAVFREQPETAAVVTRIAPSFLRFGHFEFMYHRGLHENLQPLADFVIDHYFQDCRQAEQPYVALADAIARRTADLVAAWQSVGFCHGVLNTDNMSLLGLTIDYGPFGFLDAYDRRHVCNHSDNGGRYAYNEQPYVTHWNLSRLVSCLLPLAPEGELVAVLDAYPDYYQSAYLTKMRAKLGLQEAYPEDEALVVDLFNALQGRKVDFTLFFRYLSELDSQHAALLPAKLLALFDGPQDAFITWVDLYRNRLNLENSTQAQRVEQMNQINPLYVLRNYLLEQAITAAQQGDFTPINRLQNCLYQPYREQSEYADFAAPAPDWAEQICVSCSS